MLSIASRKISKEDFLFGLTVHGMSKRRESQRLFLQQCMDKTGLKASPLATAAGITPSTLTKFVSGVNEELQRRTIDRLAAYAGIPSLYQSTEKPSEVVPFHGNEVPANIGVPQGDDETFHMIVQGTALEDMGILPGDILTFDRNKTVEDGDVVAVQSYDMKRQQTELILRQYQAPFLVGRSRSDIKVLMLTEGGPQLIIGVLVRQVRDKQWGKS